MFSSHKKVIASLFVSFLTYDAPNAVHAADAKDIVADTEAVCYFLPTADTIAGIIVAAAPGPKTAKAITKAIYASLPNTVTGIVLPPLRLPTITGVPVLERLIL
jgi:hypothetical protein